MRTWDEQKEFIEQQGGQMYTLVEMKEIFIEYGSTWLFPKQDIWVAVWDDVNERKDWFSLGEKGITQFRHLGSSHLERFKIYPTWGDDNDVIGEHMTGIIYKKQVPSKAFEFPCENVWSIRELDLNQIVVIFRVKLSKKDKIMVWDGVSEVSENDVNDSDTVRCVNGEGNNF